MGKIVNKLYQNNATIYKVILFLVTTIAIVYLFPKGTQFQYDFNNGQLWKYDNLYAPFDFAIQKTDEEIKAEKSFDKQFSLMEEEKALKDIELKLAAELGRIILK